MTEALILAGADIVKVGIGPGSVCTTRKVAGVGYPQLSAIAECADAAHGLAGHVMADGGCSSPGDVAKAFASGADFVMLGGMFAGHDESGGELVTDSNGKQYMSFYGMSSAKAMETHYGEVAKHRAPEGKEVRVPYRGPVEITVQEILGGVRSACSYVGARRIKDLPKCTTFIRRLSHPNESSTFWKVFDTPCTNIGTSRPNSTKNFLNSNLNRPTIRHANLLSLWSTVLCHLSIMSLHRLSARHSVE
jgi:GMP reductase